MIAYWILTLVSKLFLAKPRYIYEIQSVGPNSQEYVKSMQVEWTGNRGAAGNHVELKAGGGITVFHTGRDDGMFSSSFKLSLRWIGLDFSDLKQSIFGLMLITSGHRQRPFS
jgi:hypothetical protein